MKLSLFGKTSLSGSSAPKFLLPQCGACQLYKHCNSPKMPVAGKGKEKILIVSDYPGQAEDQQGKPFVGPAGRYLASALDDEVGIDLFEDCWVTNSLICLPPSSEDEEKSTHPLAGKFKLEKSIEWCRPNITKLIKDLNPEKILVLGSSALKSVIEPLWGDKPGEISAWVDYDIPCRKPNTWVHVLWNPAFVIRKEGKSKRENPVRNKLYRRHLSRVFAKKNRPWEEVPDYLSQVRVVMDDEEASKIIDKLRENGRPVSFDYETTMLKPDPEEARIICCSVSNGKDNIAFPWHGKVIGAMKRLLTSDVPKWGYSIKFEDRWTRKILGTWVNNWQHDGMIAAHVLNNWPGTKSLKFQAFVLLGQEHYAKKLEPYMEAPNSNSKNKLWELYKQDSSLVLRYNALDSLLEHKVAKIQRKQIYEKVVG